MVDSTKIVRNGCPKKLKKFNQLKKFYLVCWGIRELRAGIWSVAVSADMKISCSRRANLFPAPKTSSRLAVELKMGRQCLKGRECGQQRYYYRGNADELGIDDGSGYFDQKRPRRLLPASVETHISEIRAFLSSHFALFRSISHVSVQASIDTHPRR